MPLIKVQTSVADTSIVNVDGLLKSLSSGLASHLGKPESYVMTAFESGVPMTFAGTSEPVCYVEIKSVGTMGSDKTGAMSTAFCQELSDALGVEKGRIYIEFADSAGYMWGWNGRTF
ncbi:MAG: phenylpyruvate tautomerase MIF-related protein [Cyanobacteria bacterium P01_E01_bin.45]